MDERKEIHSNASRDHFNKPNLHHRNLIMQLQGEKWTFKKVYETGSQRPGLYLASRFDFHRLDTSVPTFPRIPTAFFAISDSIRSSLGIICSSFCLQPFLGWQHRPQWKIKQCRSPQQENSQSYSLFHLGNLPDSHQGQNTLANPLI